MKKLILCDVDSTLTVHHQPITKRTRETILALQANGYGFGLASGRPVDALQTMLTSWGIDHVDIIIGLNGAALWDGLSNRYEEYFLLKKEWLKEIVECMEPFHCLVFKHVPGGVACTWADENIIVSSQMTHRTYRIVEDIKEFYEEETPLLLFRTTKEKMPEIEAYLQQHPSPHYYAFKTQEDLLEFGDKNIRKSYALEKFCEYNHFDLADVVAFGDTTNDNDLLMTSGKGVCMLNGSPDTKKIADDITDKVCEEDGWADYIEKHYLNPGRKEQF